MLRARGKRPVAEVEDGRRAGAAEQADDEAADHVVGHLEDLGGDRGAEREVEPAQRPGGDRDRNQGEQLDADAAGDVERGPQRGQGAGPALARLRHPQRDVARRQQAGEDQDVDQVGRQRPVLDQGAGGQGADREPADRRQAADDPGQAGRLGRVEIDQGRPHRRHRDPGRDPLDDPRQSQHGDAAGDDEDPHRQRLEADRERRSSVAARRGRRGARASAGWRAGRRRRSRRRGSGSSPRSPTRPGRRRTAASAPPRPPGRARGSPRSTRRSAVGRALPSGGRYAGAGAASALA